MWKGKELEGLQRGSQSKTNGEEMALEAKGTGWVAEDLIWFGEQTHVCRLIHKEHICRHALMHSTMNNL